MISFVTGEYPPMPGGVADYTRLVARGIARRGEAVEVWAPGRSGFAREDGISVWRAAGNWRIADLLRVDRDMAVSPPRRIVIQWTPHSFGYRSLNVPFALWVWKRARLDGDRIELMVHEPFLAFEKGPTKRNLAAWIHRGMLALLLDAAAKAWIAIPAWERRLRGWARSGRQLEFAWLPVPANIAKGSAGARNDDLPLVGHLGTFRADVAALLEPALRQLLDVSPCRVLLVGRNSTEFAERLLSGNPEYRDRVTATGDLPAEDAGNRLAGCDVALQPYPDGVSSRRGTAMAALALGVPLVTNLGALSEPLWRGGAVALAESKRPAALVSAVLRLIENPAERLRLRMRGTELYEQRFDLRHTVDALLGGVSEGLETGMAA